MRFFLTVLFLACPLLAQDKDKQKSPDRAEVMRWLLQLNSGPAQRKEAEAALLKLTPEQLIEALRQTQKDHIFFSDKHGKVRGLRLLLDPGGSREIINGSWTDGDQKVTYNLKSLGKGRYKLTGSKHNSAGDSAVFSDKGTLAELKQRHEFLKANLAIRVPSVVLHARTDRRILRPTAKPAPIPSLGITVKMPSEDLAYHLYLPQGVGLLVTNVSPGSVAEKLGLKKWDVITRLDGKWIEQRSQLNVKTGTLEYLRRTRAGRLTLE